MNDGKTMTIYDNKLSINYMFIKLVCNLQALQVLIALAAQLVGMTRRGYKISLSPQLTALAVDENSSHFSYQAAIAIPGEYYRARSPVHGTWSIAFVCKG